MTFALIGLWAAGMGSIIYGLNTFRTSFFVGGLALLFAVFVFSLSRVS